MRDLVIFLSGTLVGVAMIMAFLVDPGKPDKKRLVKKPNKNGRFGQHIRIPLRDQRKILKR